MPFAAILAVLVGLFLLVFVADARFAALPLSLTAAVLLLLAGRSIRYQTAGKDPWSAAELVLVLTLLTLLIFWDTERTARWFGEEYAADIVADPQQFGAISVYSKDDLKINAPGVTTDQLGGSGNTYHFRYSGLRLMERSADRFVLINELWHNGQGRVIVLKDNDEIRIEFLYPYY